MSSNPVNVMKKIFLLIAFFAGVASVSYAQKVDDVGFENAKLRKNGELMTVSMGIDLAQLDVRNRRSVHIIPVLKNGADSLELAPVGIYSRGRYINYLRNGESVFEDLNETVYKEREAPEYINYSTNVDYQPWMDGAKVFVSKKTCGCCQDLKGEEVAALAEFKIPVFDPSLIFIRPQAETEKTRELSGEAFIDFVVSRMDIDPDYRNNKVELAKIIATIDSVKSDKDVTVKSMWLKGYASPESPYENNERLAKGRTESLKQYVQNLYHFDSNVIVTDYEPENWAGLRAYVEAGNLPGRNAILSYIDGDRDPDTKEWLIKSKYPETYRQLLDNCYPALRKTDYKIEYAIKVYTDIDEIVEVFRTAPNKLSLEELYLASTAFDPSSEEYSSVFETAVRMYPNDPVSNLNAANVEIANGNYKDARAHLLKAGEGPEVTYAWGLYYIGVGDYDKAEQYLKEAREHGIAEASEMLRQCAELKAYYAENE